jgi:D-beta-D-heptose 7-phosphate kinase/D-beta-D-heptose 1-phosphate adenosyltransferase
MLIEDRLKHKILTPSEVINFVTEHRAQGDKIIFTNGCFDLIHLGHLEYLLKARELGGILIVGVNSDQSVRSIKNPNRPIMPEEHRYHNLAAYYFIDAVVPFSDETPLNLIKTIKPDVLVKGSDYKPEDIVGYDTVKSYGGDVVTISTGLSPDIYSTTKIIERVILSEK